MDELLFSRVKQLREIDERLERIERKVYDGKFPHADVVQLRRDVQDMISTAEAEHEAF